MRKFLPLGNGRLAFQLCAACAVSALMAGCSSDATRLSDPFTNPFQTSANEPPRSHVADAMPAGRTPPVSSRTLSAPARVATVAPLRPNLTRSAAASSISRETTGSIEPAPQRTASGAAFGGWSSSGGVPITVGEGETVDVIAKRYGVPPTALLATNGLSSPSDVRPGSSLTIPVYNATAAHMASVPTAKAALLTPRPERVAAAERREAARAAPAPAEEAVTRGEPPHALRLPPAAKSAAVKTTPAKTAAAKVEAPSLRKNIKAQAAAAPAAAPIKTASLPATAPAAKPVAPAKIAAVKATPVAPAVVAQAAPAAKAAPVVQATTEPAAAAPVVADASGNPEFRWPARGRIIQGFKGGNDGINIALPDGTPVKAAEGGTVAYAGSELKGYGNLVLIRHPNGFVTAYANNGEISVKRGDQVKRGQVIAKSGQSGNVSSPQLHFELRKGSTPVDPTTYLAGL